MFTGSIKSNFVRNIFQKLGANLICILEAVRNGKAIGPAESKTVEQSKTENDI